MLFQTSFLKLIFKTIRISYMLTLSKHIKTAPIMAAITTPSISSS